MTDWIDFVFCAAFLAAAWFAAPTTYQRLAVPMLEDRNADWVAAHPDIVRRIAERRWHLWLSYALGAFSLCALASFQLGLWEWTRPPMIGGSVVPPKFMLLVMLTIASMFVWIPTVLGPIQYRMRTRNRRVPAATRRQAPLERRSIADFVPPWIRYAIYILVVANILVWIAVTIAAAAPGTPGSPSVRQGVVATTLWSALSAIMFFRARGSVARRADAMDRIFGPGFRGWHVRSVFSMQILSPVVGMEMLYVELTGTMPLDLGRAIWLIMIAFATCFMLRMSWLPVDHGGGYSAGRPAPQV